MANIWSIKSMTLNYDGGLSGNVGLEVVRERPELGKILLAVGDPGHPATSHVEETLLSLGADVDIIDTSVVHNTDISDYDLLFVNRAGETAEGDLSATFVNYVRNAIAEGTPACLDPTTAGTGTVSGGSISNNIVTYLDLVHPSAWTRQDYIEDEPGHDLVVQFDHKIVSGYPKGTEVQVYDATCFMMSYNDDHVDHNYVGRALFRSEPGAPSIAYDIGGVVIDSFEHDLEGNRLGARVVWSNLFYAGQNSSSGSGAPYTEDGKELLRRCCLWARGLL